MRLPSLQTNIMPSVIPSGQSLETDRLLANSTERTKVGNEPTLKQSLIYGLTSGKAIWAAQVSCCLLHGETVAPDDFELTPT
jgi:hypothetical protein